MVEQARADERRKPILIAAAAVFLGGMLIWALLHFTAASKAQQEAKSMKDQRDKLAQYYHPISKQLKKENDVREVADRYTQAESDRVFWFDLIAELRGAFASDSVWLTEFEPIAGFDAKELISNEPRDSRFENGQAVVSDDFMRVDYGLSALAPLRDIPVNPGKVKKGKGKKGRPMKQAEAPKVNAVRIRGYWRENLRSQNLVSDLLKQLREKSTSFDFTVETGKGKRAEVIDLTADQYIGRILTVAAVPETPEDLAQPFEIILPLARGVEFK